VRWRSIGIIWRCPRALDRFQPLGLNRRLKAVGSSGCRRRAVRTANWLDDHELVRIRHQHQLRWYVLGWRMEKSPYFGTESCAPIDGIRVGRAMQPFRRRCK
jgi:hypothetical protein